MSGLGIGLASCQRVIFSSLYDKWCKASQYERDTPLAGRPFMFVVSVLPTCVVSDSFDVCGAQARELAGSTAGVPRSTLSPRSSQLWDRHGRTQSVPRTAGLREAYRRGRAGKHLSSWTRLRLPAKQPDSLCFLVQRPRRQYPVAIGHQPAKKHCYP